MTTLARADPLFDRSHDSGAVVPRSTPRVQSIDAARGLTMFVMIFVNLLGPGDFIPWWMRHWHGVGSGLTFVDLVFPAFLFIAGMSIPFALSRRLQKESLTRTLSHVTIRTASLLMIGVLMVNERPDTKRTGWSGGAWEVLMYACVLLAFLSFGPPWSKSASAMRVLRPISLALRVTGFGGLLYLALVFRGPHGERLLHLWPFYLNTLWWGILGHIGWAYLMASVVFIAFRTSTTAIVVCIGLMLALYSADYSGTFSTLWLTHHISIGGQLGTRPMITTSGMLLAIFLLKRDQRVLTRVKFTLLLSGGLGIAAFLLAKEYGVGKVAATPTWALIGCVVTALIWLAIYLIVDVQNLTLIARPLTLAGENVFLAYILSEMFAPVCRLVGLWSRYVDLAHGLTSAISRTAAIAVTILLISCGLNRAGIRLRL